jgi:hypothetical protein|tara:strand:- start:561 stop:758 length:198 start_codon:yes stop_codon:yes gene_type:complete
MSRAQNNSWEYLREKIRAQMNDMSDHVSGGACKEFSDYQKCCGIIEGLALAERELLDLQAKLESD